MLFAWVALSFIAGIAAASLSLRPDGLLWLGGGLTLMLLFTLAAWLARRERFSAHPFLQLCARAPKVYFVAVVAFCFGGANYAFRQPNLNDPFFVAFYNDRGYEVLVSGTLDEPPDLRDSYANLRLKVEAIDTGSGDMPARGILLARVKIGEFYRHEEGELIYGQRVRARGKLKTPPENEEFSYRDYLARSGVYSYMTDAEITALPGNGGGLFSRAMYLLKARLLKTIYALFHDPEASLLAGILLGVDQGLSPALQEAFKNTGTAHIIAISGFNIAIIAGVFFAAFRALAGERLGAFLAVLAIAFYTLLVGADAAVARAAIMGSLSLFARQVGKRNSGLNALALAALLMLIYNPLQLWDVGFQLSALATLGLILYAEPFSNFTARWLERLARRDMSAFSRFVNENVVLTLAAQLTTIPIMAYHFQRISLISFIANPFILPFQPMVMILGGLAALTGLAFLPLGRLLAWVAAPFPFYTIRVVEFFNLPQGVIVLNRFPLWLLFLTYAALFGVAFFWDALTAWLAARKESLRALGLTAAVFALFVCSVLVWRAASAAGDGQLHLTFFSVGSANAILIQTPGGRNVLIDGGASASRLSDQLGRRLPFFSKNLDWLVVASTAESEIQALPRVMEIYPPKQTLWSGNVQASYSAQRLMKFFAARGIPVHQAEAGQKLKIGEEIFIQTLAAGSRGSVLLVEYKNFRALLPIGVDAETYAALENGKSLGKIDALLLADSGYAPSNPPEALKNFNPRVFILSVEAGDPDGLPDRATLDALEGYPLLRTDLHGWVSIVTDGNEMRVQAERGYHEEPTPAP